MLTQEEVKSYAHMRRLKLIDQIWKDYLQDVMLHLLYRKMPKLVFGGGTCIWKIMKGDRFSEDLDMYASSMPVDIEEYLKKELSLLGINCIATKKKKARNMLFLKLALSFPSHTREIILSLEFLSGKPDAAINVTLYSPYPDIPPVDMLILSGEELLANKISALYGRNKARDVHDIYFLLKSGTKPDMKFIRKKVHQFSAKTLEKKIFEKKTEWKSLEQLIVTKLPLLKEEAEYILRTLINQ